MSRTRGTALKKSSAFLDRHVEHVGDRLALERDVERLAVVALALADVAGDVDVRQEVHLDLDDAVALAGLAAAALDVEREAAGLVAARLRLGQAGEPFADRRERAGVGRGVGARRAADRRLVDVDDLVEVLEPLDAVVRGRGLARAVELARDRLVERVDQQRRLAAAGDAGDAGEQAERDFGGDVLEVVAARVDDLDGAALPAAGAPAPAPSVRRRDICRSATSAPRSGRRPCPARRCGRRGCRRRGRCRARGRRCGWRPRRARPRSRCCRGRAAACSVSSRRALSRWCRPIDGSSST